MHSMQPVYGQTRGLSNKTIVKAEKQAAGNLPDGSLFGKAFHESKD